MCSALPVELQKHCLSYIPCRGITNETLEEAGQKLLPLSTLFLITRGIRPWFGHKFRRYAGEYTITKEFGIDMAVNYSTPFGGCWYPIACNYLGDGEYQSLCVHKSGDWVCEWEFGRTLSVFSIDDLRLNFVIHQPFVTNQ